MKTSQYIWQLIRYRPGLYTVNGLLWTLIHFTPLFPGLVLKALFDTLTERGALTLDLWSLLGLLVGISLARVGLIFGGVATDVTHRFSIGSLLRRNLLERILERPGARALPDSVGEAISRFRDDGEQVHEVVSFILDLIGYTLFAGGALFVLVRIDSRITLLVFLPLVLVVIVARMASKYIEQYRRASREATGQVTGAIGEIFGAVQAIQVAGAEQRMVGHFRRLSEHRKKWMLKDRLLTEVLDSIFSNTVSLGTGLILILAAQSMSTGTFTVGDFALFVYYLTFVTEFTTFFGRYLALYRQSGVALQRMDDLLQGAAPGRLVEHHPLHLIEPAPPVPAPTRTPADRLERLDVAGLTYHFPDSTRGVENVSLSLERGSFTVITGRIGSGKTTLLRILLGLLPAQGGEIRWNGTPVQDPGTFFIPPRCAYTAQIPTLFSETVQENILLGLPLTEVDLTDAVHSGVLDHDLTMMEQGLATPVGARGVMLSGGQIQRIAAARMFVRNPALFVFDDLSSALDVETERLLWERVFKRPDATCLVVSHRRTALRRADRIILLKDGQVADEGRLNELLERSAEMRTLWQGGPDSDQ